uniref:6.8 kDa mitochondrial proteolipid n=2 Tax=Esox lucius TaxID=8010 RepID=A0AAY5K0U8_ESOLU
MLWYACYAITASKVFWTGRRNSFDCTLPLLTQMAGRAFANWWTKMRPYYAGAYQEMWVGLGIMTLLYYKISYGGKKEVKGKPAH